LLRLPDGCPLCRNKGQPSGNRSNQPASKNTFVVRTQARAYLTKAQVEQVMNDQYRHVQILMAKATFGGKERTLGVDTCSEVTLAREAFGGEAVTLPPLKVNGIIDGAYVILREGTIIEITVQGITREVVAYIYKELDMDLLLGMDQQRQLGVVWDAAADTLTIAELGYCEKAVKVRVARAVLAEYIPLAAAQDVTIGPRAEVSLVVKTFGHYEQNSIPGLVTSFQRGPVRVLSAMIGVEGGTARVVIWNPNTYEVTIPRDTIIAQLQIGPFTQKSFISNREAEQDFRAGLNRCRIYESVLKLAEGWSQSHKDNGRHQARTQEEDR